MLDFVGDDAFTAWVVQFPALAEWVLADLTLVCSLVDPSQGIVSSQTPMTLIDLRDALVRLYRVASEAGFVEIAALFYRWYERCCLALLPWWPGGMEVRR